MKLSLWISLMMTVSLAACSWWGHKRQGPPNPTEIIVNGAPADSVVFIDGSQAGQPAMRGHPQLLEVSPGNHKVEVHAGDRVVYREEVYVATGEHYIVSVLSGWNP
ncbi:MAG TPA: hypothetical protein VK437_09120 [Steroidobacteraceae bacterium]|nr:hypothetical protein [Steroidobacteraceae bacterium]